MAKYEETTDLYNKVIKERGLETQVNITVLSNNTAKEVFKINKANELLKFRTGDDVIIVINEKIFDQLTPEQRNIVVEESLSSIHYDNENDKLVISKPDVVTFSGVLSKHTFAVWDVLRESIKTLYAVEKEAEQAAKDATAKATKKQFS
jgi:hypothetical protein